MIIINFKNNDMLNNTLVTDDIKTTEKKQI